MITGNQRIILSSLIDMYEKSATFRGENKVRQRFMKKPEELFPKYADEREYEYFVELNQDIRDLQKKGFIETNDSNMKINCIILNTDKISEIYELIGRKPKKDTIYELKLFLDDKGQILRLAGSSDLTDILIKYLTEQKKRLGKGKLPEYYADSMDDYADFWNALLSLTSLEEDIYIRDLSIRLFSDSKRLEALSERIKSCLYKYGEFPVKDTIPEELGVIKTPSYVMVKGPIRIRFGEQTIDIGKLRGDISFSTQTIKEISGLDVYGKRIITIENLTSFHEDTFDRDSVLIYLGGYHSQIKRDFLRMIYLDHEDMEYYHFGDIDVGGFYIYEHLRRLSGIPFKAMNMNKDLLEKYRQYTKKLTLNDKERIKKLILKYESGVIDNPEAAEIITTLKYMLEKGIKLEQEAL